MPFTIGGEWIPEPTPPELKQPIKITKEKRRGSYVTLILHLSKDVSQLKKVCSTIKQQLGCGGSVKDGAIELQGDQIENCKKILREMDYKIK